MATQDQLRRLAKKCTYLRYTETSKHNSPPHANGGLQMFSPGCGFQKVAVSITDKVDLYLNAVITRYGRHLSGTEGLASSTGILLRLLCTLCS